ncbi:MAG: hypothetical protein M3295_04330 [Chloroflexota bacterium]|nr:hypothetical protein [Chloroflexota bacterium]
MVVALTASVVALDVTAPCPRGGALDFGDCVHVRPLAVMTTAVATGLYVGGLSGVVWWIAGLRRRRAADARTARDWYVLGAAVGLLACPLLAFTLVSAFR